MSPDYSVRGLSGPYRVEAAQHSSLEHDRPAVLEHPHLAAVLVLDVARRFLPGHRLRLEDGAPPALPVAVKRKVAYIPGLSARRRRGRCSPRCR